MKLRLLPTAAVRLLPALLLASATIVPPAFATNAPSNLYSGQAVAIRIEGIVNPAGLDPLVIADTGDLPDGGGSKPAGAANVNIADGGLTASVAGALATGAQNNAVSVASLKNFHAEFITEDGDHLVIEADLIEASAAAGSLFGKLNADTKVTIRGLRIDGNPVAVTGAPNQVVLVGESRIILNEQAEATDADSADAAVTAIHFYTCECVEGWLGRVDAGFTQTSAPVTHRPQRDCGGHKRHDNNYHPPSDSHASHGSNGGRSCKPHTLQARSTH